MTQRDDMRDGRGDEDLVDEGVIVRTGELLRSAMPAPQFSAGFAERTMARVAASRVSVPPSMQRAVAMQRSFRILAAAAAIAIVALGVHNTWIVRADDTSFVEAAIGLQPVSAASVLAFIDETLQQ
jgi:hypothetical protein